MNDLVAINGVSGRQYNFSSHRLPTRIRPEIRALYIYAHEESKDNCIIDSIGIAQNINDIPLPNNTSSTHILVYFGNDLETIRADITPQHGL